MTTTLRTQYFVAENGYGEEALFAGTGTDDNRCQEVVTRCQLDRLSPDLWGVVVAHLTVAEQLPASAKPRTGVNRDRFNGQVRALFRDPREPALVYSHWLSDDEARALAAQLLATAAA
jgi:hypothetical protein